jgi:hypothetical protein
MEVDYFNNMMFFTTRETLYEVCLKFMHQIYKINTFPGFLDVSLQIKYTADGFR